MARSGVYVELELHSKSEASRGRHQESLSQTLTPGLLVLGTWLGGKALCTHKTNSQVQYEFYSECYVCNSLHERPRTPA